jgi:hypothetical protein
MKEIMLVLVGHFFLFLLMLYYGTTKPQEEALVVQETNQEDPNSYFSPYSFWGYGLSRNGGIKLGPKVGFYSMH